MSNTLEIENLHVHFNSNSETVHAVNGASFEIAPGEVVGLVGESGCGKSVTARSIVRLESPGEIVEGSVQYGDQELTTADDRTLQRLRGRELAMVFQDPSATLNPVYPVGEQIAEALRIHRDPDYQPFFRELALGASPRLRSSQLRSDVLDLMKTVGIPNPRQRVDAYPHQFSGGMRQRAMLAIALARQPSLLIADEPTTALDTTTQAAILDRLATLNEAREMGMLVISHDFGVVSALCDRIVVMYDGVVVEQGPAEQLQSAPAHPYTKALLGCLPQHADPKSRLPTVVGTPPDGSVPPTGCEFADRCPFATDDCRETDPSVVSTGPNHAVRCEVPAARQAPLEAMHTAQTDGVSEQSTEPASIEIDGGTKTRPSAVVSGDAARNDSEARRSIGSSGSSASRETGTFVESIVELEKITKSFRESDSLIDRLLGTDDQIPVVKDVSLKLRSGETLGLVGESGCGKSTLANVIAGLEKPDDGTVRLRGRRVGGVSERTDEQLTEIGVVFQHPGASLNPKRTVSGSIAEPLVEAGWAASRRADRITELLSLVGLSTDIADRYPRQLSGGQRQRVAIGRALALEPSVLVLDEPTAALDVSIQATVLNLLADLQDELGLTYLYVSHNLDAVRHVADRVAVMYCGQLVEIGPARTTLSSPTHPYTQTLLDAIPDLNGTDRRERTLAAEPPSLTDPPSGCAFHPRCPIAEDECSRIEPTLEPIAEGYSRCLYADEWVDESGRSQLGSTNCGSNAIGAGDEVDNRRLVPDGESPSEITDQSNFE
ncbi:MULTISPECIES: dipeptide ABC transporter ATP-binding protein [Natrialbaceae]|uniref:dipeptide ABC transporter ATP-binding protein n=1 Tax=Natrialbaceae TaxID=1644061 RepID=UPI00207CC1E0|nr:ABC transporter ATP-binding protein [Natronococcus sp. CG52]